MLMPAKVALILISKNGCDGGISIEYDDATFLVTFNWFAEQE